MNVSFIYVFLEVGELKVAELERIYRIEAWDFAPPQIVNEAFWRRLLELMLDGFISEKYNFK